MTVEQYGVFESAFEGKTDGNPFTDYEIHGVFEGAGERKEVQGFYDGNRRYVIRFMPSGCGEYRYHIEGTFSDETYEGSFEVIKTDERMHGPVHVRDRFHFAYADGTPYFSIGTTCYVWELQSDKRIEETLQSLKESGFNKIRFCIFPKHYLYNLTEPRDYPFPGTPVDSSVITPDNFMKYDYATPGNSWDFTRFRPEYFRHIEKCILALREIGTEADLIVFHPYDRWGFSNMPREAEVRYLHYIINRFAAFSNVWWSMANEFDILPNRTDADWSFYGRFFAEHDPYQHLRSIHQCFRLFDHSEDWVTHVSYQRMDLYKTAEDTDGLREKYGKPVVLDEIAYEGNIPCGWGNISGQEMVRRFWEGAMRGGYPGHGETVLERVDRTGKTFTGSNAVTSANITLTGSEGCLTSASASGTAVSTDQGGALATPVLWWSHGGKLKGESWKRVKFLLGIMAETPGGALMRKAVEWDCVTAVPQDEHLAEETGYRIDYYSFMCPSVRPFEMPEGTVWDVEVIDTWNMTIEKRGSFSGKFEITLPGRQYMAIRLRKVK